MSDPFKGNGIIVSCQAYPGDPMFGETTMMQMALAAEQGGAVGIRANGEHDIRTIVQTVALPVVGLIKRHVPGSEVYITPGWEDAERILAAGAKVVAMDVTIRENREEVAREMIAKIHAHGGYVLADVSTAEEGILAERLGADYVSTTLSGYTPYSPQLETPDFGLVAQLSRRLTVPVIAEGRIWAPDDAVRAMEAGAAWVVVGSAITRPELITQKFAERIRSYLAQEQSMKR